MPIGIHDIKLWYQIATATVSKFVPRYLVYCIYIPTTELLYVNCAYIVVNAENDFKYTLTASADLLDKRIVNETKTKTSSRARIPSLTVFGVCRESRPQKNK